MNLCDIDGSFNYLFIQQMSIESLLVLGLVLCSGNTDVIKQSPYKYFIPAGEGR